MLLARRGRGERGGEEREGERGAEEASVVGLSG